MLARHRWVVGRYIIALCASVPPQREGVAIRHTTTAQLIKWLDDSEARLSALGKRRREHTACPGWAAAEGGERSLSTAID